jgi:hypothetical protein
VGFGEDDEVCVAGARGFADEGEGFGEGGAGVHVNGGDVAGYGFEVVSEVWFDLVNGVCCFPPFGGLVEELISLVCFLFRDLDGLTTYLRL